MEVKSNRIGDIRSHYRLKLVNHYEEREADQLLFILFEEFAGLSKSKILSDPFNTISESELLKIHFGVKDLMNYKPIQYILGKTDFYGLELEVNADVLIPRPETEELIEFVIKACKCLKNPRILDIGTGSGCIAILLKKNFPIAEVIALDISAGALRTAKRNAKKNHTDIKFFQEDFLSRESWVHHDSYDFIVSNPPYVQRSEMYSMGKNVLKYEPAVALFADENDPLLFYRTIAEFAYQYLKETGTLFCEINQYLGKEILLIMKESGFASSRIEQDLKGNDRFVIAEH